MQFEDRQYQIDAAEYAYNSTGRPILCAPTGSGKTVIAGLICQKALADGKTFGFLTPREEILYQNHTTVGLMNGEHRTTILKAGHEWQSWKPIHIVSWPTLVSRSRKGEGWFPNVDVLVIDEAHLAVSPKMVERVLPYYADRAQIIGLTATPSRKNGRGLGYFFDEIKHVTNIPALIEEGKLAPLEYWAGKFADVSSVKTVQGDFHQGQLEKATKPLIGDVIENWLRLASNRHTLVFAVNIAHAEALKERFQQAGISAAALHVHMTPEKRHRVVEAFREQRVQVLVNVSIASYGFDVPTIDCVVLAAPTKSIVKHLQSLGRGMRIAPGKTHCMVLDHADNVRRLGAAEDPYRWRLSEGREAAANWARHEANPPERGQGGRGELGEARGQPEERTRGRRAQDVRELLAPVPALARMPEVWLGGTADLVRIKRGDGHVDEKGWPDDATVYRMLIGHALARSYSLKWAEVQYKKKYGKWAPWGYKKLGPLNPDPIVRNFIRREINAFKRKQRRADRVAH
jgi:superfamily II DNA or RNA helicase